jgi:hypothetical protein
MTDTVFFNGMALLANDGVLKRLNLKPGQAISKDMILQIIACNVDAFCEECKIKAPELPIQSLQETAQEIIRSRQ